MDKSWLTEEDFGQIRYSYALKDRLYSRRSNFQKIDVVETEAYGRMLLLDDLVMITEVDEFVYHELISHIPVCYHRNPKKVLVIGGGDGGTVRELAKYDFLEEIVLCELDEEVVRVSKEYFPEVAQGFNDKRVRFAFEDGVVLVRNTKNQFDIIIVDSTDPVGPGEVLFTKEFYRDVKAALKPGGMMVAQTECPWFNGSILRNITSRISANFDYVNPYIAPVPTYPRGMWSWTIGTDANFQAGDYNRNRFDSVSQGLEFLNVDTMSSVFALPTFYRKKLGMDS